MTAALPSFASPPVTEVVIATRFEAVASYSVLTAADLARVAADSGHDVIEERPGYEAPTERFGPGSSRTQVSLEVLAGPPPARYWFRNASGDELLQLQPNWIAANWRKVAPTAEYGRWDSRWNAFASWASAVEQRLGPPLRYDQVEVTYVNHIERQGVWEGHGDASAVFAFLSTSSAGAADFLPRPEQTRADVQFVIPHPTDGRPIGRLHASVAPVFKLPADEPAFVLNLTARGEPLSPGLQGVRSFADIAHEWIVRGFAELTNKAMHAAWQRTDQKETP